MLHGLQRDRPAAACPTVLLLLLAFCSAAGCGVVSRNKAVGSKVEEFRAKSCLTNCAAAAAAALLCYRL
jgi:hypothetical protein